MGYHNHILSILLPVFILLLSFNYVTPWKYRKHISTTFYDHKCPNALSTIKSSIKAAVSKNPRNAASVVRLLFHDCFVQGCDASLLLEGAGSEKGSPANEGVLGYEVIDVAKAAVERICPGVVSCADILALAARDASVAVGGPSWIVRLGRRDSTTFNASQAVSDLPRGNFNLSQLISSFAIKGLNTREMVALSGSHTIGQARCIRFRPRIYNASNIDPGFASALRQKCPPNPPNGDGNLQPLDLRTPNKFDNNYFRNLVARKGLLTSDQALFNGDSTDSIVRKYVANPAKFDHDFAQAMVRMSEIQLLTGTSGIIRTVCTSAS